MVIRRQEARQIEVESEQATLSEAFDDGIYLDGNAMHSDIFDYLIKKRGIHDLPPHVRSQVIVRLAKECALPGFAEL